jgi:hypothetical protein
MGRSPREAESESRSGAKAKAGFISETSGDSQRPYSNTTEVERMDSADANAPTCCRQG